MTPAACRYLAETSRASCKIAQERHNSGESTEGRAGSAQKYTAKEHQPQALHDNRAQSCNRATAGPQHHLNMLWRQHLRAAVDEPRHVCRVVRHAHANVVGAGSLQSHPIVPVLHRDVRRQVNVLGTDDVRVPQLAHEQHLHTCQLRNHSPTQRRRIHNRKQNSTSRSDRCSPCSVSDRIFLTATIAPRSVVQHSTTPAVPLPMSLHGRRFSGRMKPCCERGMRIRCTSSTHAPNRVAQARCPPEPRTARHIRHATASHLLIRPR